MSKFVGSNFVATVDELSGDHIKANKHGKMPIVFRVRAGKCPKKRAIDGTVAEDRYKVGKTYLLSSRLGDFDPEHGQQYKFDVVSELDIPEDNNLAAMALLPFIQAFGHVELIED